MPLIDVLKPCLRRLMAMFKARIARSFFIRLLTAHPTTRREYRSMMIARYSQPLPVQYMADVTHPFLIGPTRVEIPIQEVGCYIEIMDTVGCNLVFPDAYHIDII